MIFRTAMTALAVIWGTGAQAQGFDPRHTCAQALHQASDAERMMIAAWTFGYIAGATQNTRPVDQGNNAVIFDNLTKACQSDPRASLLDLVAAAAPKPAAPQGTAQAKPGSEAEARALLEAFVAPGADHRALTQAILPTQADVARLYADPLGARLWADLSGQLTPQVTFAPKRGQTDVLVVYTTTRALLEGAPALRQFPGGYKDVVQYFKIDVPIVRFKFVKPGETSGYAFDGLVYLNGRWVIIPKPWRSLPG